jgi:hypothetical protein
MTRVSCPSCRLRFTPAAAALLTACPQCGRDLHPVASVEATLGYRLFDAIDSPPPLPLAAEIVLPIHAHRPDET